MKASIYRLVSASLRRILRPIDESPRRRMCLVVAAISFFGPAGNMYCQAAVGAGDVAQTISARSFSGTIYVKEGHIMSPGGNLLVTLDGPDVPNGRIASQTDSSGHFSINLPNLSQGVLTVSGDSIVPSVVGVVISPHGPNITLIVKHKREQK